MATDLLVLGAGPAGAAISLLMARKGYSVEIVDAAHFPRTKICGEFLNPQAVQWLNDHGLLGAVEKMNPFPIYGMKVRDRQGYTFQGRYKDSKGYAIQRKDFDSLLISRLKSEGIPLQEGFHVSELMMSNGSVSGVRGTDSNGNLIEKKARIIIGADGRNNLIGRTFGWMQTIPGLRKYAFLTYFKNISGLQNYGEIHLVRDGYIGVAPLDHGLANVALVVDEKTRPADSAEWKQFLLDHLQQTELNQRIEKPEPLTPVISAGPLAFTLKQTSGRRTILVGDTCGFIDPFTGEGINYAFLTASLAADVLHQCFSNNRFDNSALMNYDTKRQQLLGRKFQMARLLQKAVHSPRFSRFLVRRFAHRPTLADTMISAVGSAIPIQEVWNLNFLMQVVFGGSR